VEVTPTEELEALLNGQGPLCCGCSAVLTDAEVDACEPDHDEYCAACWKKLFEKLAEHYRSLATERADEGASVQLGCLVLAERCAHEWSTDLGGPTPEMVTLAEHVVGEYLDEMIAAELNKDGASS
jgi:hypothetical protein